MRQLLGALAEDRVLSHKEKEQVIETAVCPVFSYSAGLVDWTRAELDLVQNVDPSIQTGMDSPWQHRQLHLYLRSIYWLKGLPISRQPMDPGST